MKIVLQSPNKKHAGFVLVSTMAVMSLLVIVALGMISMSKVETRVARNEGAKAKARANAHVALMVAIGELQKALGPDQAVTARASMVSSNVERPNLLGVWDSWRWEPQLGQGPDYGEKVDTFKQWLVSTRESDGMQQMNLPDSDLSAGFGTEWQWMVNPDTIGVLNRGSEELYKNPGLKAEIVSVNGSGTAHQEGGMSWAVLDQSMGVSLALTHKDDDQTLAIGQQIARRSAPDRVRPDLLSPELSGLDDERQPWTFDNTVLLTSEAGKEEVMGRLHDFSVNSLGVLSDVTRGGLKIDLSNVFESESEPAEILSSITGESIDDEMYFPGNGAPRWAALKSNYKLYEDITNLGDRKPRYVLDESKMQPYADKAEYEENADSPDKARLLPVITKLQIVYSLVTHPVVNNTEIQLLNELGGYRKYKDNPDFDDTQPEGPDNQRRIFDYADGEVGAHNYAVPKLAYDPVVTLYNPYDVGLELPNLRIRVWDPPVGFKFLKDEDPSPDKVFLSKGPKGNYWQGLAQLQEVREDNTNLRQFFNLMLVEREGSGEPGAAIVMQPGEVRVFSPYIEDDWTWGMECPSYYYTRAFNNTDPQKRVNERDNRDLNGIGQFGMRCVPGWDTRAGYSTQYNWTYGPIRMHKKDVWGVMALPYINNRTDAAADFIVDILAGQNVDEVREIGGTGRWDHLDQEVNNSDILRRYEFNFGVAGAAPSELKVAQLLGEPINGTGGSIDDYVIEKDDLLAGDLFQSNEDTSSGGKTPFVIFSMTAKSTTDEEDVTKPWLYNNLVTEGALSTADEAGMIHHGYDLKVKQIDSFTSFPGIEITGDSNRGFYGSSSTASRGVTHVPAYHIPIGPAVSLGELVHTNMTTSRALPRFNYPFGNSKAHPLLSGSKVSEPGGKVSFDHELLDHSYMLNDTLWDRYFFSSVIDQSAEYAGEARDRNQVLSDLLTNTKQSLNSRLIAAPLTDESGSVVEDILASDESAAQKIAGALMVKGMFNVNSDSVDAWYSVILGLRDEAVAGWESTTHDLDSKTGFPRSGLPLSGDGDSVSSVFPDVEGAARWSGFRALDDAQVKRLAENIVLELRKRGAQDNAPLQSIGEFVNRRMSGSGVHTLSGVLQTAIDNSGINNFDANDSQAVDLSAIDQDAKVGLKNAAALEGESAEGSPVSLTQGDLMSALSSFASVRGDTFTIRAYGDARDKKGRVIATAWCEATVQRLPEFIDSQDEATTPINQLSSEVNKKFGRRFTLVSFRWLSNEEV